MHQRQVATTIKSEHLLFTDKLLTEMQRRGEDPNSGFNKINLENKMLI